MVSKVNPNFPIPGLDQSSKGFRDNFATIKKEIEAVQGTTIQLTGGVLSNPIQIGDTGSIVIETAINGNVLAIAGPNRAIQFNDAGQLTGDSRLVFDNDTGTVGIGTNMPNQFVKLDVAGKARFVESVEITQNVVVGSSYLSLKTPTGNIAIINSGASGQIGSVTATNVHIMTNSVNRITVSPTGNVGIGTAQPTVSLDIRSNTSDMARFRNSLALSDTMVRFSTSQVGSTVSLGLEHINSNKLGGIRINSSGTVSIHTGASSGATLTTSTARISIDDAGKVGIGSSVPAYVLDVNGSFRSKGITDQSDNVVAAVGINNPDPQYELDVIGNIAKTQATVSNCPYVAVGTTATVIDVWPMDSYRSARYTIQVTNGTDPAEQVDIYDYVVVHANGAALGQQFNYFSSGIVPLGTVSVNAVSGYIEVSFTGAAANNAVRLDKTYIVR